MSHIRVGFLGLGTMGTPMALNLKKCGFPVVVWNRSPDKARALQSHGLTIAATPEELAQQVDVLCTCLADPPAVEQVALGPQGLLRGVRQGQLFIDFSTLSVGLVRLLAVEFAKRGVDFADAPVTGSKNAAEKGTLVIMTGCFEATLTRATPIFQALGEKIVHCGPIGAGTQVKLAGNALIASMLQAFSEGLLLTAKAGVDPRKFVEVVQASGFRSPYFDFKGKALFERDFAPNFTVDLMHKDLSLFLDNAAINRVPTPAAAAMREAYNVARASNKGSEDIAAVITAYEGITGTRITQDMDNGSSQ